MELIPTNTEAPPIIEKPSPEAFTFVMATGIVARDSRVAGMGGVASALLCVAVFGYLALLLLLISRTVRLPMHVADDLASPRRGPAFLALVAATGVLGLEVAPINVQISTALWVFEAILWLGVSYTLLASVAAHEHKPPLTIGLSGRWLLAVVATQSVALLGVVVASQFGGGETLVVFISLCVFFSACVLYLAVIPLIINRLEFLSLTPRAFTPDYWIDMGAVAITTLTGTLLISASTSSVLLQELRPFLLGLTLLFWAGATWWIPLLTLLEVWRHVLCGVPVEYRTAYWSLVFPVGMYAACTFEVSALVQLGPVLLVAQAVTYLALGLWLMVFVGLACHLVGHATRQLRRAMPS